jgi:exodeoxyribonuclease VII large subunit
MRRRLEYAMQNTDSLARRLVHPGERLRSHRQLVTQLLARLAFGFSHRMHRCSALLERFQATLASVDPSAVLARGYSITRTAVGEVIRDAAVVKEGEVVRTTLARGSLESEVRKKSNL